MHSNTVIVPQLHETQRQRVGSREEEGEREPEKRKRVIMGGGEAGREEVWTMSSLLPRKQHKQSVKMREHSGADKGTAQGQAIIRHWLTKVLYRVKTGTRTNLHCKSICKL